MSNIAIVSLPSMKTSESISIKTVNFLTVFLLSKTNHGGDNGLSSTFWIRDGKYVRLKTAQLGYTLPKQWTSWLGVQSFRIFAEGQNLFTLDGLPEGIDPESPGVNNGYYPQQRLVMGGITLTF